jgi:hypothetical protein
LIGFYFGKIRQGRDPIKPVEFPDLVLAISRPFNALQIGQLFVGSSREIGRLPLKLLPFLQPGLYKLIPAFEPHPDMGRHVEGFLELESGSRRNRFPAFDDLIDGLGGTPDAPGQFGLSHPLGVKDLREIFARRNRKVGVNPFFSRHRVNENRIVPN